MCAMKVAIMQPYFFPYIGYFQLIGAVDLFILYDNIKYTKKGWINRNRFLRNGAESVFSVPLRKDSDFLDVKDRSLADTFNRGELVNQLRESYRRAPQFDQAFPVVENAIMSPRANLFDYIHGSVSDVCRYLGIGTSIVVSSGIAIDPALKAEDRVLALCNATGASCYINAIGGQELYTRGTFAVHGVALKFLKPHTITYSQFGDPFVPWLSIVDVMMFNPVAKIREFLENGYDLV